MPIKITNFTTEGSVVKHYNVKGFNDVNQQKNYAYSYGSSRGFSGGNKDGYSIKVTTKELLKRSEANKIMIVMSDGLPSDYRSHSEALSDVKNAVKEARKNGIKVIAMFFGDSSFRKNTFNEYKAMYERNLINCSPENITKELVKEIRKLFMTR
jgi:nitric oxide reductase activation protein